MAWMDGHLYIASSKISADLRIGDLPLARFLTRRVGFILLVTIIIVFAAHLGMRMIRNSEARTTNLSMLSSAELAWQDTRAYLNQALQGYLGSVREVYGFVPVQEILRTTYINSMGLLLAALAAGALGGLVIGTCAASNHKSQRYCAT